MKRTFVFVLLAAALLLSACGGAASANHLEAIKKAGVIKLAPRPIIRLLNCWIRAAIKWVLIST